MINVIFSTMMRGGKKFIVRDCINGKKMRRKGEKNEKKGSLESQKREYNKVTKRSR